MLSVSERKPAPAASIALEQVQEVLERAGQAVELPDHDDIAGSELVEQAAEFWSVPSAAGHGLLVNLLGTGLAQQPALRSGGLVPDWQAVCERSGTLASPSSCWRTTMPRRRLLTDAQRASLLALPTREPTLIQHFTLVEDDLTLVATRKHPETKLGLALQLCALRYPGRLLRPGELIPAEPLAFIAEQVGVPPDSLAGFARRGPTRYEQLGLLYRTHGFQELTRPHRAELAAWLLPIARETTVGLPLVEALLGEMRRRRIVIPGISVVERLAAAVLHDAEREVWSTITGRLGAIPTRRLEMLLEEREHERQSRFSWLREPVGASAMHAILDRLDAVRRLGLDRAVTAGIPATRLRQLAREGARLTAQGLRQMTPPRRRAILTATILELGRLPRPRSTRSVPR